MTKHYIHGSSAGERQRLALMNSLINDRCLEVLGLSDEKLVLDVGAGTGLFTHLMARHLPSGSCVVAVELDPEQVNAALQDTRGAPRTCTIDFRIGNAADLPLERGEQGRFDLAHTRFLLEHVPKPLAVVRAMVAAVRPGGRVVLADDDHDIMRFWPEPPGLAAAWKAYYRSYVNKGNDPLVGRKLTSLLYAAGARPSFITQVFYGACAGSRDFFGVVDNLVRVLQGARNTVLAAGEISASDYDRAIENFIEFRGLPDAALWYVINWAEGRVPG